MLVAILFTVIAITIANTIGNLFPRISNSYFEIAMGIIIAVTPILDHMEPQFNFPIFMLTIAPLLFFEGQITTATAVTRNLKTIFSVAGLLVIISTVLVGGLLTVATGITLSVAFVLAVVSAPTDATALENVSAGVQIPGSDSQLLKLEGLFNDASGLVLLEITILFLHGAPIKLSDSVLSFIQTAGGGVAFGLITGGIIIFLRQLIMRVAVNLSVAATMIYVLSPFVIFLSADALHFSGILAVVAAGIIGNGEIKHARFINARQSRWSIDLVSMLSELLNGGAFLSLGMLAARIIKANLNVLANSLQWVVLGILLYVGSTLVRYFYIKLTTAKTVRSALIFAFGGVHGAVNLALALSLLEYHLPRSTFEMIVMAEMVFILLSMLVPPIVFKRLLPAEPAPNLIAEQSAAIKRAMVKTAVEQVTAMHLQSLVQNRVILDLQSQIRNPQFRDFFDRRHSTTKLTDQNQQQRQQALRLSFSIERHYLRTRLDQDPQLAPAIDRLYNEVLLAESVAIDLTDN